MLDEMRLSHVALIINGDFKIRDYRGTVTLYCQSAKITYHVKTHRNKEYLNF